MFLFTKIGEIKEYIAGIKNNGQKLGFVPTMGALHQGHISLIDKAKKENDFVICSIFVNPIQFNNKEDLKNYPRDLKNDSIILGSVGCDAIFCPSDHEMYPEPNTKVYDLNGLDKYMEGAHRPGHFNGVAVIVFKLFDIIQPDQVYFGEKDYQQLTIIKYLTNLLKVPVSVISCPTVREKDGLAMSSRNKLLTAEQRKAAPHIYQSLQKVRSHFNKYPVDELKKMVFSDINSSPLMSVEYFEIVDKDTLEPVADLSRPERCVACIAVNMGKVRLIDNIKFL
jgi:pantoate--beta-alanine ligase